MWTEADAALKPEEIQCAAETPLNRRPTVIHRISHAPLRGPDTPDGRPAAATDTTGLKPFIGREFEIAPVAQPVDAVAKPAITVASYLLFNGMVFKCWRQATSINSDLTVDAR